MKKLLILLVSFFTCFNLQAQQLYEIDVYIDSLEDDVNPIWKDFYEMHLMYGYGGNPRFTGPHASYVNSQFYARMNDLKIRSLRLSIGRADTPPDTNYYSTNTSILRNLPCEFYRGTNTISDAQDTNNYHFDYLDSLLTIGNNISEEILLGIDYMPFTLSSDTTVNNNGLVNAVHYYAFDNSIRNSPPRDTAVYGEVMYNLIKFCHNNYGVKHFEFWNEPDQFPGNTFFWKGSANELFAAYKSIIDHVSQDSALANSIKIGGCSFAFNSTFNLFPTNFLNLIQQNNTRMDFLSFHPYSNTGAGYDSNRVIIAQNLKNQYVPNADLWVTEWSRIDANPADTMRARFDYGLLKLQANIDMLNRGVKRAHAASLADDDIVANENNAIGSFMHAPFSAKRSIFPVLLLNEYMPKYGLPAYNFKNVKTISTNQIAHTAFRFEQFGFSVGLLGFTLAIPMDSITHFGDTVVLRFKNLNAIKGTSPVIGQRHELGLSTTASNVTKYFGTVNNSATDTIIFNSSDQNNGKLYVWHFSSSVGASDYYYQSKKIKVYPNPNTGNFYVELDTKLDANESPILQIRNMNGQLVYRKMINLQSNLWRFQPELPPGLYILSLDTEKQKFRTKLVIQ